MNTDESFSTDVTKFVMLSEVGDGSDVMTTPQQGGADVDAGDKKQQQQAKAGWPKGKRRKKVKDENAPKQPLSGYLRFLNERREALRAHNSGMSFADVSRLLGAEWSRMAPHDKQRYLDEAEADRQRYQRELDAYHLTDTYKLFRAKLDTTAAGGAEQTDAAAGGSDSIATFDIPIFTEDFIAHNKSREAELRRLRKENTELEENNAILGKHVDNMRAAVTRLEVEAAQQRNTNLALQEHLDTLRVTLASHFAGVALPGGGGGEALTPDTVDAYMAKLHAVIIDAPQQHEALITSIRDVVARLNFHDLHKM